MTRTRWIWIVLGGLYAVFFYWYTSFGGPLTDEEVEHYMSLGAAGVLTKPFDPMAVSQKIEAIWKDATTA